VRFCSRALAQVPHRLLGELRLLGGLGVCDTSDTDLWPVIAMISRSLPSRTYRTPSCFAASRTSTERPL
jgi:hypothetical protein